MKPRRLPRVSLFLFFLSLYLLTTPGHFYTHDSVVSFETTQSLFTRGDLKVSYSHITVLDSQGRPTGRYGLLQSVLCIPLYWLGDILEIWFPLPDFLPEGWRVAAVATFNQWISALSLVVFCQILRQLGLRFSGCLAATLVLGFATPWWTYSRDLYRQPLAGLLFLWAIHAILSYSPDRKHSSWVQTGLALGLSVLNRITAVVTWPGLFVLFLSRVAKSNPKAVFRSLLGVAFLVILGILLQIGVNYWRFHDWWGDAYENRVFRLGFLGPNLSDLFLSPTRGLFLFAPPLLLFFQGVRSAWGLDRALAISVVLMVGAKVILFGTYGDYTGGMNPGPRYLIPILPVFFLPVGILIARDWHQWSLRISVAALALVGFVSNGYNTLIDYTRHLTFYEQVLSWMGGWERIVQYLGGGGYSLADADNPFNELPAWDAREVFSDVLLTRWWLEGRSTASVALLSVALALLLLSLPGLLSALFRKEQPSEGETV